MLSFVELTDAAILRELGRRLEAHRLERNLTQIELGDLAGLGRSTIQKIEGGGSVQTASLVKVLRALDLLTAVDAAIPDRVVLPVMELDRIRRTRRRARHRSTEGGAQQPSEETWTWGDES
ncbi:helix-turn-helix domain-containing protein [Conexibacter sp. S30A1]|uniref:helix-turn-helix domain-containing protein n=1 Tax=Conexibacter sp. S30A1 TaxID=2937800 RepID=UPI00200FC983|nr:helix-turn-helix transcriptional regulator [Conexibacter sp. S30A1]